MGQLNSRCTASAVTELSGPSLDEDNIGSLFQTTTTSLQITGGVFTSIGRDQITVNNYHGSDHSNYAKNLDKILDWLSIINFREMLMDNLEKRTSGTGLGYIQGEMFQSWVRTKGATLWGTGIPGAGKTILASAVFDYLQTLAETSGPGEVCVSFAYCRYTEPMAVRDILSALVRQFLERHPTLVWIVEPVYERHSRERIKPSQDTLVNLLVNLSKQFKMSYFGLDGLDEAKDSLQFDLLKVFTSLNANFFITSRPLKMLESVIPQAKHFTVTAPPDEIELLLEGKINGYPAFQDLLSNPGFKREVLETIKSNSGGMFLHASLQIDALQYCLSTAEVRDVIGGFPAKLEDMYAQTMDRIAKQPQNRFNLAMQVFTWLVYARGPLTFEDLQFALAFCPDTESYDTERLVSENNMCSVCCGLIAIDTASRYVRLIHYTARDSLEPFVLKYNPQPQALLASTCIARLMHSDLLDGESPAIKLLDLPFLPYAHSEWSFHARLCYEVVKDTVDRFIHRCKAFPLTLDGLSSSDFHISLGAPHMAAWFGFRQSLTPGEWASRHRERSSWQCWTPLIVAAKNGHDDIVEMLIHLPDADVNLRDSSGWTALMHAASQGRSRVVSELLRVSTIDVNVQDGQGQTPLILATRFKHTSVALELIAFPGVRINATRSAADCAPGWTALMHAVRTGNETVLRCLLRQPDIHLNNMTSLGQAALTCAIESGHILFFSLLVEHAAIDVNVRNFCGSALILAVKEGHHWAVEQLVRHPDIEPNATCFKGRVALMYAAEVGDETMVDLLLGHPATKVNAVCNNGRTSLMEASYNGHARIVRRLLLCPEIKVGLVCDKGRNALEWAAEGARRTKRFFKTTPGASELGDHFRQRDYATVRRLLEKKANMACV